MTVTEQSNLWRAQHSPGVELLKASFRSFAFEKHSHEQFAIGMIESGAEGVFHRGETVVVPAGSMILINPGEVHTGFAAAPEGWRYRLFYVPVELLEEANAEKEGSPSGQTFFADPVVRDPACFSQLVSAHCASELGECPLVQESSLVDALRGLVRRHASRRARGQPVCAVGVSRAQELIHAQYHQRLTLGELTAAAGLNRVKLTADFRSALGLPPHAYLMRLRADRARQLILDGATPADAAAQAGFSDQSHLTRTMKRFHGVTPGALGKRP